MSANGRLCCKSLLALLIKKSLGSICDFGINMRGTSSHSDKLTGDFGNKHEAILIGDHVLSCLLPGKLSLRDLRLLQQYRPIADKRGGGWIVRSQKRTFALPPNRRLVLLCSNLLPTSRHYGRRQSTTCPHLWSVPSEGMCAGRHRTPPERPAAARDSQIPRHLCRQPRRPGGESEAF